VADKPRVAGAAAGYWHHDQTEAVAAKGVQVLIPPDSGSLRRYRLAVPAITTVRIRQKCQISSCT
jgi:hypothetical protein